MSVTKRTIDTVFELSSLHSDVHSYNFLAVSQAQLLQKPRPKNLVVDFSNSSFIEANLFAVIGAILPKHSSISLKFSRFDKLTGSGLRGVATRNGFLNYYGTNYKHSCLDTTIQYRIVPEQEIVSFAEYIHNDALKIEKLPQMSAATRKKIIKNIMEIFSNSITHGRVKEVYVCGQFFPNKKELKITLVDLGCTIKRNVQNFLQKDISAIEAIQWATRDNNTTRRGHTPGGLGLKLLRDFLKHNKGALQIISDKGFWEERNSIENTAILTTPFKGTIVTIIFNTNDTKNYILKEEVEY